MSKTNGITPGKRYQVLSRCRFRCHYCGAKAGDVRLEVDHVTPRAKGGTNGVGNLVAACPSCNRGKGANSAHTNGTGPLQRRDIPPTNAIEGWYCHKSSDDPEHTRFGWNWEYQARVETVLAGVAMLQFFDAIMGRPSEIKAMPLPELLSGEWVFYRTSAEWRDAGAQACARYQRGWDREHPYQPRNA